MLCSSSFKNIHSCVLNVILQAISRQSKHCAYLTLSWHIFSFVLRFVSQDLQAFKAPPVLLASYQFSNSKLCSHFRTQCHNVSALSFDRFFINLLCGESESSDIALHFNPRFDGWDKVVFNSCQDGSWGSEEKIRDMPFCKGNSFEMVILATSQGYQVRACRKSDSPADLFFRSTMEVIVCSVYLFAVS